MTVQVRVPCRRLDDGRAQRLQVGQIPRVDVKVNPALDGLGLGTRLTQIVLKRRPYQQALAVILGLPGATEHGRPPDHGVGIRVRRTRCSPDPCPAAGSVIVAGLRPWRDWLVPTLNKAAARSLGSRLATANDRSSP